MNQARARNQPEFGAILDENALADLDARRIGVADTRFDPQHGVPADLRAGSDRKPVPRQRTAVHVVLRRLPQESEEPLYQVAIQARAKQQPHAPHHRVSYYDEIFLRVVRGIRTHAG